MSTVVKSEEGRFLARGAPAPASCPPAVGGNGAVEPPEACDDGNLDDEDACRNDCTLAP